MRIHFVLLLIPFFTFNYSFSQGCCSGGSASPIAGGTSQGVLNENQLEIAPNFQHLQSSKFYAQDRDTAGMFNKLASNYLYLRVAYGISKKLTMSIESGYYINRTQFAFSGSNNIRTSGIADLIIFPRYEVYKKCTEQKNSEFVLGLGYKIPVGHHNDSTDFYTDPMSGQKYYQTAPPNVHPTNGSNDFIFYSFWFNNYLKKKVRFFANSLYVRKGWNSLGQKFGDYASVSVFIGKTVYKHFGITTQLKAEWEQKMKTDKLVDMVAFYNVYPQSTGNRKVFFAPQISYNYKALTVYALSEIPIYQYLNGSQVGSQYQYTVGLSYKIDCSKKEN